MSARKIEEQSYWPGYVDAIINVVLNILFMMAVFVVALSTVDFKTPQVAKARSPAAQPTSHVRTGATTTDVPEPVRLQQIAIAAQPYKSQSANQSESGTEAGLAPVAAVMWERHKLQTGEHLVTVDFDDQAAEIPTPVNRTFNTFLSNLTSNTPNGQWLIWVSSDIRQASASRLAYLRILSVRTALVEAGVSPERIATRIIDIRGSNGANVNRVQLVLHTS